MTNPDLTLIAALLDRSGSMHAIKSDTEGGFRALLAEQAAQPGQVEVTLAQFDNAYELVYPPTPIDRVPEFELEPRGSTALLDALGKFIVDIGKDLADRAEEDRPGTVIVVVMTDGQENMSAEWTVDAVRALVEQQRSQWNWQFMFLGASLDAVEVGRSYGFSPDSSIAYAADPHGTRAVMNAASATITRSVHGRGLSFTEVERDEAAGEQ